MELFGILGVSKLRPSNQLALETNNLVRRPMESPFVLFYLPVPAGPLHIVAHLSILKLLLEVRKFCDHICSSRAVSRGEFPSSWPILLLAADSSTLRALILAS